MSTEIKRLRLLLIEDQQTDAELLLCYFERAGIEMEHVLVEEEGALRTALAGTTWDAVISDYSLPNMTAPEALEIVRELAPQTPFIMVTGTDRTEIMADLLTRGACGCLLKDPLQDVVRTTLLIVAQHRAAEASRH